MAPGLGNLDLFDVVFCSGDEGVAKPDPAAFVTTLEILEVERRSAVFIDDTPENVEAARSLGIPSILFTDYRGLASELAAFVDPAPGWRDEDDPRPVRSETDDLAVKRLCQREASPAPSLRWTSAAMPPGHPLRSSRAGSRGPARRRS